MSLSFLAPLASFAAGAMSMKGLPSVVTEGKSFLQQFVGDDTTAPSKTIPVSANDTASSSFLQQKLKSLIEQFEQRLQRRLDAAGVDPSQPVVLQADSFGDVVCANNHPDRDAIEQLFHDDPLLAATFREIEATSSRLNPPDEGQPFTFHFPRQKNSDPRSTPLN